MKCLFFISILIGNFEAVLNVNQTEKIELHAITITSYPNDGLDRLKRSASIYGINLQVFEEPDWIYNRDMTRKIFFTREKIKKFQNATNVIILFVDAFDVIFTTGEEEILKKFLALKANVVFAADQNFICDKEKLKLFDDVSKYQPIKYLNSGTIIGYAPYMYKLYSLDVYGVMDHDQCVMSYHFLNPVIRRELNLALDYNRTLFQPLNLIKGELEFEFSNGDGRLISTYFGTKPAILHGNGRQGRRLIKLYGNYVAKSWTPTKGCLICQENRIHLHNIPISDYPRVLLGIFVKDQTSNLEEMLQKIVQLIYPKDKMFIYIYNNVSFHEITILQWILDQDPSYPVIQYTSTLDNVSQGDAKNMALQMCKEYSCDVFYYVDSKVILDNPNTLNLLISYNRSILAPLLIKDGTLYSTIYGDMDNTKYNRTFDYLDIVKGNKRGIWNVSCIYWIYVMWSRIFNKSSSRINYVAYCKNDSELSFCTSNVLTHRDNHMYAVNLEYYGHVMNTDLKEEESDVTNIQKDIIGSSVKFRQLKHEEEILQIIYKKSFYLEYCCIAVLLLILSLWTFIFGRKFLLIRKLKFILSRYLRNY